jgi:hypothetical protein
VVKITENLQRKFKKASDAILTLKMAIDGMKTIESIFEISGGDPEEIYRTFRDSMVQRFEYTFDLT